jgi:hypothetical protein
MKLFFGKTVLLVAISMSTLFGMEKKEKKVALDTEGNKIDWPTYKKLYFSPEYGYPEGTTPFGTQECWKLFKEGVEAGAIVVTPLMNQFAPPNQVPPQYFLAYSSKVEHVSIICKARFLYQSPGVMNGDPNLAGLQGRDLLFHIAKKDNVALLFAGWGKASVVEEKILEELYPTPPYFPEYKNNKELAFYIWKKTKDTEKEQNNN